MARPSRISRRSSIVATVISRASVPSVRTFVTALLSHVHARPRLRVHVAPSSRCPEDDGRACAGAAPRFDGQPPAERRRALAHTGDAVALELTVGVEAAA